ncbi:hypothetical protein M8C21_027231 [Ambrosia artemisiifolia]|uniref:Uncharacterized protein n=1 Tax=Ambrosia artemisiifolia TaxID=4212 RepID=A0AAD5BYZ2_AMBAR|nr:hypothetical protein M8C21_027231 [Ambrosia artemisiifolia]
MFSKGILLQDDKVLFSLGSNRERNEMVSAKRFSYKNPLLRKWRSLPESRFPKVAEMLYISNLNIRIKIRTQFLSPCINYKVHLIFKFCGSRKSKAKRMYVNLKYKMGNESLNAYFATWREDGWMMIELFQFLNHKKDTDFEVLLESFSRCYCGSDSVYIEGIQFQAIDNASHKKRKKDEMLSANEDMPSNVAIQSRFSGAIEFQRQQVLHIKCEIKIQLLSANAGNVCYLVFKLSEKCCGLHGPVIVRDMFHWRSKETGVLYFRYPNPWNVRDTDWLPRQRKDGWMEELCRALLYVESSFVRSKHLGADVTLSKSPAENGKAEGFSIVQASVLTRSWACRQDS